MCCEGSRHRRRAPMRSRCCSGPGRPLGDTKVSGRRVTSKAPLAHLEGGSGQSKTSPTAILEGTHSLEGVFSEGVSLLKKSLSDRSVVRNTQEPRPKHYKTVVLNP